MRLAPLLLTLALAAASAQATSPPQPAATVGAATTPRPQVRAAVSGANRFSLELYKAALKPTDNLVISPASVSLAVALAYRGAEGPTAAQMRRVFHYTEAPGPYLATDGELLKGLALDDGENRLYAADAVWVNRSFSFDPTYEADMQAHAVGGVRRVDFVHDPAAARAVINGWVAHATADRIAALLAPGDVRKDTRSVLVSALYWKGMWSQPFAPDATRLEPFIALDGRRAPTPLMHQQDDFRMVQAGGVKLLLLPYTSAAVSMIVALPDQADGLPEFEARLTPETLSALLARLDAAPLRPVRVTMPKMHLDWRDDLASLLSEMGGARAFSNAADFLAMGTSDGAGLKLDAVIHQARFDVDERTTEAAAATAVTQVVVSGSLIGGPKPLEFRADKPFLFLLRDNRTGLILFIGRYVAPQPPGADRLSDSGG